MELLHIMTSRNLTIFLRNYNITFAFKSNNTLYNVLINNKDEIDIMEKNGVYKIKRDDGLATYIGQIGRRLETRIRKYKKQTNFSFSNIYYVRNNTQLYSIIHNYHNSMKLKLLEEYEIDIHRNKDGCHLLNKQMETYIKPMFFYVNNILLL